MHPCNFLCIVFIFVIPLCDGIKICFMLLFYSHFQNYNIKRVTGFFLAQYGQNMGILKLLSIKEHDRCDPHHVSFPTFYETLCTYAMNHRHSNPSGNSTAAAMESEKLKTALNLGKVKLKTLVEQRERDTQSLVCLYT